MKKLVTTAVLSFLTIGSLPLSLPTKASAFTSKFASVEHTPHTTSPTNPKPEIAISQSSSEQKVAYSECYYEIYYDGSYFWICR